jgi:FkbM family methyltransferase
MIEKIEDSLNGGYGGLYGEVVTEDVYRLKSVSSSPDVVFDLGCNVGIFTRYARELFPDALIISVEPNEENFRILKQFTFISNWVALNVAIGKGQLWHNLGAANGSGESYVSSGIGYKDEDMQLAAINNQGVEKSKIRTILPAALIKHYVKPGQKYLVKIDIEGGEHAVFQDKESMDLLLQADYVCMEFHLYALYAGELYDTMVDEIGKVIARFMKTHLVTLNNMDFTATKK